MNSTIERIASLRAQRQREKMDLKARMQQEFDVLLQNVEGALRARNRFTPSVQRQLSILRRKLFDLKSYTKLSGETGRTSSALSFAKKTAVSLLEQLNNEGVVVISPQLLKYLHGEPGRAAVESDADVTALSTRIETSIIDVFIKLGFEYTKEDVEAVLERVRKASLKRESLNNLYGYARACARNWVIDKRREPERDRRRQALRQMTAERAQAKAQEAREREEKFQEAKRELEQIMIREILAELKDEKRWKATRKIGVLYETVFLEKTAAQLGEAFPGIKRNTLEQWRKRARDYVWETASENLKYFLSEGTFRKRA